MMDEHFDKIQASLEAGIAYTKNPFTEYLTVAIQLQGFKA